MTAVSTHHSLANLLFVRLEALDSFSICLGIKLLDSREFRHLRGARHHTDKRRFDRHGVVYEAPAQAASFLTPSSNTLVKAQRIRFHIPASHLHVSCSTTEDAARIYSGSLKFDP